MAWSHIGSDDAIGFGGSATPTLPTVQADDVIVITALGNGSAAASTGYTQAEDTTISGSVHHTTLYRIATGSEGNPPVTITGTTVEAVVSVYRSDAGAPSLDASDGQANPSQTASTAPGVAATNGESLAIHTAANPSGLAHTPPTGYTEPAGGEGATGNLIALSYNLDVDAGDTGDVSGTYGSATNNSAHLLVFTFEGAGDTGGDRRRRGLLLPL